MGRALDLCMYLTVQADMSRSVGSKSETHTQKYYGPIERAVLCPKYGECGVLVRVVENTKMQGLKPTDWFSSWVESLCTERVELSPILTFSSKNCLLFFTRDTPPLHCFAASFRLHELNLTLNTSQWHNHRRE